MLPSHSGILAKAIHMWTSQLQSPPKKKVHKIPTVPHLPPTAPKQCQEYINQSVTYWFSQYPPSLVWVKSPQARLTDHHKQDFSFLAPTSDYRVIQWPPTRWPISKQFWLFFDLQTKEVSLSNSHEPLHLIGEN